ncbi:outer membrane beta-barrel protein [Thalassotalea sediminis]|uniref:outer membrane beta-barrel protein n=1 Tax=Thalassotalea sediminis TaxID=1759089 RepID=UPI0025731402|nr:outer membrane beta-barrel protein [Thalassotalea sediminis]
MKQSLLSLAMLAIISTSALAEHEKQHTVGIQFGGGGLEHKGKDTDGEGVGFSYLYYNYKVSDYFSAEVGIVGAEDVDDWECQKNNNDVYECYSDDSDDFEIIADDFDYGSVIVAVRGDLQVSKHNTFYGKLGVEFYDYQFDFKRKKTIDEDGTGLFAEIGWEYRWDNGMGLNAGYQFHNAGDLDMNGLNLGVSYAF